jgi:hypothetical protein
MPNLALVETKKITVQSPQLEVYDPLPAYGSSSGSGAYGSGPNTGTHFLKLDCMLLSSLSNAKAKEST